MIAIADGWGENTNFLHIKDGSITVTAWDLTGFKKNEIVIRKHLQEVETANHLLTENLATGNFINVQVLYLHYTYYLNMDKRSNVHEGQFRQNTDKQKFQLESK